MPWWKRTGSEWRRFCLLSCEQLVLQLIVWKWSVSQVIQGRDAGLEMTVEAKAPAQSAGPHDSSVSSFECTLSYVQCFVLATIYVGSLYVWKDNKLPRYFDKFILPLSFNLRIFRRKLIIICFYKHSAHIQKQWNGDFSVYFVSHWSPPFMFPTSFIRTYLRYLKKGQILCS